jgi:hypothetical protein
MFLFIYPSKLVIFFEFSNHLPYFRVVFKEQL